MFPLLLVVKFFYLSANEYMLKMGGSWHGNGPKEKVKMEIRKEVLKEFIWTWTASLDLDADL